METQELEVIKKNANAKLEEISNELEKDAPEVSEVITTITGTTGGGAISLGALSTIGISGLSSADLSSAGITSGLATAGATVGGGMVAGIGVLAIPATWLRGVGFTFTKRRKHAKKVAVLSQVIDKLCNVQKELLSNAEHFTDELAGINSLLDYLEIQRGNK